MSKKNKNFILNKVSVRLDCMSSCKKQNLSKIFNPKPKPKPETNFHQKHNKSESDFNNYASSCHSSSPSATTNTTLSSKMDKTNQQRKEKMVRGFGRVGGQSMAVEKESNEPYFDFRQSMLQMILDKQIYTKHELKELLDCFLQLNSPYHHRIIVRAFAEIWNDIFSIPCYGNINKNNYYYSQPSPSTYASGGVWSSYNNTSCYYYDGCNASRELLINQTSITPKVPDGVYTHSGTKIFELRG